MQITITKGKSTDFLAVTRSDGTHCEARFPHKGPVPHDAMHVLVERALGLRRGFWGLIDAGNAPDQLVELAKAGGHASAERARVPDAAIVELLQAERMVEAYEALLWSGGGDLADLLGMAEPNCAASFVPCPDVDASLHDRICAEMNALLAEWSAAPIGHAVRYGWP